MADDPRIPGHTIYQWAHDVLVAMGITNPSQIAMQAMADWANHESGGYNPHVAGGRFNPLNTTEGAMGYVGQGGSQGNIKDFGSYDQGIRAQAYNLTHTRGAGYESIVSSLRAGNNAQSIYSAVNASKFGTHNLGPGGSAPSGGGGSGGGSGGGGGAVSAPANAQPPTRFHLPPGGVAYTVNGTTVVQYTVDGANIFYDFSEPGIRDRVDMGAVPFRGAVDPGKFFGQPNLVHGGVVSELQGSDIQKSPTYQDWMNRQLVILTGNDKAMLGDRQVVSLLMKRAAENISDEELQATLKNTNWWKGRTDSQRQWEKLSPADQANKIKDAAAQLADSYFQETGQQLKMKNNNELFAKATQLASGATSVSQLVWGWIRPLAQKNPESPWSRHLRDEQENQRQRGVDIENMTGHARDLFEQWGIKGSDSTLKTWGQKLVEKKNSEQDLLDYLKNQATVMYPWAKDQLATGMATKDIAQPWVDTFQRVMEQPTDLFNPKVQAALTKGQPVYDFEKQLKMGDDWLNTKNARDTMTQTATEVGKRMGMIK
jgi:hypothetical protein